MTETINWKELPDKEKTHIILTYMMGCTEVDDLYGYHGVAVDPYPTCAYHEQLNLWHIRTEDDAKKFDPLHDLNDAWLIIKKIPMSLMGDFIEELADSLLDFLCNGDAESICIAALRAYGYTIQTEAIAISSYMLKSDPPEQEQ